MTRGSGPWRPPAQTGPGPDGSAGPAGPEGAAGGEPPADPVGPPPEEIHTAWVLWLAAAAFGLIGMLINSATASFGDLPAATRDAFRDAVANTGSADISVEGMFSIALAAGAVLALIVAAVTVWLAFRLRAGRGWARTMLDIVAIFLIVDAVSVVIGVFGGVATAGERGDVVSFVVIALQILAGLCAATAVWRQHKPEAMQYTTPGGGARAGK
ncbi:hypothetical protein [Dietzia sp. B32]|uniref:hypothetical protein n=1 Tax=Dietzia sp. B32 TaxID=2915130 RepID=UPI0021ADD008|nr:hypothetical protein [Dietzia sp. B32]UVE96521.1 hypothetical protein L8M95_07095 [Dietzia sp. B32]